MFKISENQLNDWISNKPPWGLDSWEKGCVDHTIGFHCDFGYKNESVSITTFGGQTSYSGSAVLIEILSDPNNYFAHEERCCSERVEALSYHNGSLLILNPETQTVHLSIWDW